MGPLAWVCCLAVLTCIAEGRPSAEVSERDARGQTISDSSDPMGLQSREALETLAYYGGAKGQFLVIHPSGRRTVSRTPPPLKANKPNRPNKPAKPEKPPKEEEDVGMAEEETDGDTDTESVAINPPPDNASVAEAKPVGLAIAGPGGVASSKPVAQAIVGPGGLAVARPVATAIAGVRGGGVPGAVAAAGPGKTEEAAAAEGRKQVFFDTESNQLHAQLTYGQRYLYPVNFY